MKDKRTWTADTLDKVPQCPHWVILTGDTINSDDGYGGTYHNNIMRYEVFLDEAEFEKEFKFRKSLPVTSYRREVCIGMYVAGQYKASVEIHLEKI